MSRHDAALEPDPLAEEPIPPPARPAAVELAVAILIAGGALGLAGALISAGTLPAGTASVLLLTVALDAGSIAVGVLVRLGRGWIVAVNYVAVLGFLDLLAGTASPVALMLGIADIVVVVILFVQKPWFDARGRYRDLRRRRRPGPPAGG